MQATSATTTLPSAPTAPVAGLALAPERGPAIALDPARPLILGSGPGADLRIADDSVSARHARLVVDARGPCVEDLGSRHGTYVDGVRVQRAWLGPGVRLRLGGWQATLVARGERRPAGRAEAPLLPGMIGEEPAFAAMSRALRRFATLGQAVLLRGETGTGKELAARALHVHGPRREGPFVALNCGAIPDGLFESELFGHVRGAFTGAVRAHAGAFVRADRGTLFLDEVAELPLPLQAKLLRALETRRVVPVGGEQEVAVDVRVVSATHQPMDDLIAAGRFRSDLFHRLSVLAVHIPALAERRGDIPRLLAHFAGELALEFGRPVELTPEAVAAAQAHAWPGNIRELRNALLRAAAVHEGPLGPRELLPRQRPASPLPRATGGTHLAIPRGTYAEMNRALLRQVLAETGSIRKAARLLEVPRSTLGTWLKAQP